MTAMPVEREIKSSVAETFTLPELDGTAGLRAVDRGVRLLDATYWDTGSLQLMRSGYGLRHRTTDGSSGRWALKAASRRDGDAMVRDELEVAGTAAELPPEIRERLRDVVPVASLRPVATLHTARHVVDLEADGQAWAEVADDTVSVRDGLREVERFREVEVELLCGDDDPRVEAVLARLRAAGAGPPESSSKYVRALRALGHEVPLDR